jgi:hypothetical protein
MFSSFEGGRASHHISLSRRRDAAGTHIDPLTGLTQMQGMTTMKTIALATIALGLFAAPAFADDAANDLFGGRSAHNAPQILAGAYANGLDMTATASIGQGVVLETGETAEIVYNRFNR